MRALSTSELLDVWERGLTQEPIGRALELLTAACPETSPDTLANLSIGQRDADLLTLREWTFGPEMAAVAVCPQCGEHLEFSFGAAELRLEPHAQPGQGFVLTVDDYEFQARPPNSLDLAAMAGQPDPTLCRRLLLERCVIAAHRDAEPVSADRLPTNVLDALEERMAQAAPQADIRLAISCPACDHQWQGIFDILSFFWSEIEAWAVRILHEVHVLASAYGWHEREILALSPARRRFYLEMVGV